ncbi:substrate-binding domain-containing protein [Undibacterium arcticum]
MVPVINVPGIKAGELMLSGEILADIFFAGKISYWNDPAIAALNRGLALPKTAIVTVVRQDGSGTTYNFTDYLSKISPSWKEKNSAKKLHHPMARTRAAGQGQFRHRDGGQANQRRDRLRRL